MLEYRFSFNLLEIEWIEFFYPSSILGIGGVDTMQQE